MRGLGGVDDWHTSSGCTPFGRSVVILIILAGDRLMGIRRKEVDKKLAHELKC